jgi:tetratricopeptide (TPR) repeat protein
MKKSALIFSLIFIFSISLFSQNEKAFEQAGRLYQAGKYDFALEKYLSIKNSGYESSELYYNIANSYYKISNFPKAILYYEKALKINPSDEDAQVNLKISNLKIVDKVNEIEPFFLFKWLKIFINIFSPTLWAVFFVISLFVAMAFFITQIVLSKPSLKKLFFGLGITGICLAFVSIGSAIYANYLINSTNSAIVISQVVNVKSGLDPTADVSFVLHEGTKVSILEIKDNWLKVKLADGREGWLPQKDAENI